MLHRNWNSDQLMKIFTLLGTPKDRCDYSLYIFIIFLLYRFYHPPLLAIGIRPLHSAIGVPSSMPSSPPRATKALCAGARACRLSARRRGRARVGVALGGVSQQCLRSSTNSTSSSISISSSSSSSSSTISTICSSSSSSSSSGGGGGGGGCGGSSGSSGSGSGSSIVCAPVCVSASLSAACLAPAA